MDGTYSGVRSSYFRTVFVKDGRPVTKRSSFLFTWVYRYHLFVLKLPVFHENHFTKTLKSPVLFRFDKVIDVFYSIVEEKVSIYKEYYPTVKFDVCVYIGDLVRKLRKPSP